MQTTLLHTEILTNAVQFAAIQLISSFTRAEVATNCVGTVLLTVPVTNSTLIVIWRAEMIHSHNIGTPTHNYPTHPPLHTHTHHLPTHTQTKSKVPYLYTSHWHLVHGCSHGGQWARRMFDTQEPCCHWKYTPTGPRRLGQFQWMLLI